MPCSYEWTSTRTYFHRSFWSHVYSACLLIQILIALKNTTFWPGKRLVPGSFKKTSTGTYFHRLSSHDYPVCQQTQIHIPFQNPTFKPHLLFLHSSLVSLWETYGLEHLPQLRSKQPSPFSLGKVLVLSRVEANPDLWKAWLTICRLVTFCALSELQALEYCTVLDPKIKCIFLECDN